MFVDDIKIEISSGKGGDGLVAFNKTKMNLGPTGGDGGKGGDCYLRGVANIGVLARFRGRKKFKAENGQDGGKNKKGGKGGSDLVLDVPVGTVVHNLNTKSEAEIVKINQQLLVAKGGRGGRGNFYFRSSRNTTPQEAEKGEAGEKYDFHLELKLIADVGFVGLPNVGKSSFLNTLTNAKSRVANYPFTTLEPSLGAFYELILADIPGLIEGASSGRGLGMKFLKHIERTNVFFHFISCESDDPVRDYKIVRKELERYNKKLLDKKEYVFLSKSDMIDSKEIENKIKKIKKINSAVMAFSILDDESVKKVKKILSEIAKEKIA